ncbi:protein-L-isoaspartate(D-aspartate) O-methyltransferase [Kitasatospora sp. SolWspMP-SS2h]|uniref:ATP-grasp peptide maturase system methyltransferase n=1 Tax=Kitasatospora sp. SolWspMP-SS2h TaxID=1305729 RepID=UPI000DBF9A35|nr:ATP-grasp peptide maturase system methyltransferase [Kitasatospora sp. SolWspMP-SS2h]RAJ34635.1 protein-L-isoaspartate(D-aspartate) O-methyltransferase [Kitasatospora sp. SolWspMP-SS2h]
MTTIDTRPHRRALADRLTAAGHLTTPRLRAAVEATPRELFLRPGVFLPTDDLRWRPLTPLGTDPAEWADIAYRDESLVTQLDNHLTADQAAEPLAGLPTSSSTTPATVVSMIEALELRDGHTVLEICTGTGYSTALLCHLLGEDNVTSIEVDPDVAARADAALEQTGHSTWTVTGDGLLGHPRRAPYDKVVATCAVRRIPRAWIRQTRPGGTVLATVGSWSYGTGLAKVTVNDDGTAEGRITGPSSFMPVRSQADRPLDGDLAARAAYPDTERPTSLDPALLTEWMPAFLTQLAAPGAQLVRATTADGDTRTYLFDPARESFAELTGADGTRTVRQGGPAALWDAVEDTLTAWQEAGQPAISDVLLRITSQAHTYRIGANPELRWEHRTT